METKTLNTGPKNMTLKQKVINILNLKLQISDVAVWFIDFIPLDEFINFNVISHDKKLFDEVFIIIENNCAHMHKMDYIFELSEMYDSFKKKKRFNNNSLSIRQVEQKLIELSMFKIQQESIYINNINK